jgi:hypothetical protein
MSTKFEQLLDYLVNEEHDKANELFHEIVVEKSRSIYENLIAEEAEEDEEMDEASEEDDESVEEGAEEDEEMDEGAMDLEDSYSMETDDEADDGFGGGEEGDAADELGAEIGSDDSEEGGEDSAMMDIKNAIQELEAAFAELEQAQGGEMGDEMGGEFGDEEGGEEDEMEMMGLREYREKVGNDWEKNSQKGQGQLAGAGTGDKEGSPTEGKSPISSGKGKPTTGATAKNLNQGNVEGQSNTGTSPGKVNKGITPEKGEKFAGGLHNVDGAKSGVKTLSKVAQNSKTPGPVGSGTGDKAGQTSVGQVKSPINGAPNRNS